MKIYVIQEDSAVQALVKRSKVHIVILRVNHDLKQASYLSDETWFEVIDFLDYEETMIKLKELQLM